MYQERLARNRLWIEVKERRHHLLRTASSPTQLHSPTAPEQTLSSPAHSSACTRPTKRSGIHSHLARIGALPHTFLSSPFPPQPRSHHQRLKKPRCRRRPFSASGSGGRGEPCEGAGRRGWRRRARGRPARGVSQDAPLEHGFPASTLDPSPAARLLQLSRLLKNDPSLQVRPELVPPLLPVLLTAPASLPFPNGEPQLTVRRSKRPATDPLWRITAPAVLRPPFPLTFLLSVAVATWKRDASALREVRTTPFPAALAAMSIERSLASPEYLNAWMFCGAPRQREFGRGVGGGDGRGGFPSRRRRCGRLRRACGGTSCCP